MIFKVSRHAYVIVVSVALLIFVADLYLSQGQLFDNWKPFGIDAY